jgi:hypothetical protein
MTAEARELKEIRISDELAELAKIRPAKNNITMTIMTCKLAVINHTVATICGESKCVSDAVGVLKAHDGGAGQLPRPPVAPGRAGRRHRGEDALRRRDGG